MTKQTTKGYIRGEYLKYKWLVIRQDMGHLCGYVKLWKGHPLEILFEKELGYDEMDINCHGGLTFARRITSKDKKALKLGFTSGYWIGWDYAHFGDFIPLLPLNGGKDWTEDEVIEECHEVIDQLTNKYL